MNKTEKTNETNAQELHVVLGVSGGIGNAITKELHAKGIPVIGINRSGVADVPEGVRVIAADVYDLEGTASKIEGVTHLYNALNVPYTMWVDKFEALTVAFLDLVKETKAKGIVVDNLYMYGEDVREPYHEKMPYLSKGPKGQVRARIAKIYDDIMKSGELNIVVVRGPDIYGPGIVNGSFYGDRVFGNTIKGKAIDFIGKLDKKHAAIYAPDYGKAAVNLARSENAYGEIWHIPHAPAITQQQFAELICKELNQETKVRTMPNLLLNVLSLFSKMLREVKEMKYEFEHDYLVDTSKYEKKFGNRFTTHEEAIKQTLEWYISDMSVKT
ncbi:MAG: NAD-dependent epimerase/dehydratase family protein [Candidatus Heimdallarchaeota archaeon]|nr:NAD-dependent epimerase/dehydratase family protein [Candidatus Heimdallarchaeota archaeon]